MATLGGISAYFLILEYLDEGSNGLLSDIEPIPRDKILHELRDRTGLDFGEDPVSWAKWFIGCAGFGTELERANLLMFLTTRDSMRRIWQAIVDKG